MNSLNVIQKIFLISIVTLIIISCKKIYLYNYDTLPAETQTGAGTFGCLVNGEVWIPRTQDLTPAKQLSYLSNGINLTAYWGLSFIQINVSKVNSVGDYSLNSSNNTYFIKSIDQTSNTTTYKCVSGNLKITKIDYDKRFMSGNFSFLGIDSISSKNISITDGRFDLKF